MDRAIHLPVAGDIHAKRADRDAVAGSVPLGCLGVGVDKCLHDFGDVALIDGPGVMKAGNNGPERHVRRVIHADSLSLVSGSASVADGVGATTAHPESTRTHDSTSAIDDTVEPTSQEAV